MALLACAAMPFNEGFYEYFVNFDPQGDAQQQEWQLTRRVFRYTSGVLCGQLLALLVGVGLSRWHRQVVALAVAVPLGALLALVTVAVGVPLARITETGRFAGRGIEDAVLLRELAAFPLYAAAGVGLGLLLIRFRWYVLSAVLVAVWCVAVLTGLLQDDSPDVWPWLMWTVPFVAAGTAIALAGLSMNVGGDQPVLAGDWGHQASVALLVGVTAYAIGLNLVAYLKGRRRSPERK